MNATEIAFQRAWSLVTQPAPMKLLNPGALRLLSRWLARRKSQPQYRKVPLFFGPEMTVVLPEIISEAIYTYGFFDETVTWLAMQSVRPGNCILDVGAHFGYFSLLFAHLAGRGGHVFSFEPTPSTFTVLERNIREIPNITALNLAAGASSGQVEIADFGLRYSAWNTLASESRMPSSLQAVSACRRPVSMTSLDAFATSRTIRPDFIKIDAENFEHAVVAGALDTIDKNAPVILLEAGSPSALEAAKMLAAKKYTIYVSSGPGSLEVWAGTAGDANARFKDILFVPQQRTRSFSWGAT